MPFLVRHGPDDFEWSGDGPCGPDDRVPTRRMDRRGAEDYLRGFGVAEARIGPLLDGTRFEAIDGEVGDGAQAAD